MADIKGPTQDNSKSTSAHAKPSQVSFLYVLLFVSIPLLPFVFSVVALSYFIEPTENKQELLDCKIATVAQNNSVFEKFVMKLFTCKTKYIKQPQKTIIHISNLLTYLLIAAAHATACLIVIGFFLYQIHQLPNNLICTYLYMFITLVLYVFAYYYSESHNSNTMLTLLGYKSICELLNQADLQTYLVLLDSDGGHPGKACFGSEKYSRLYWLAMTPVILGVLSIITASVFTIVMAREPIPSADEQWRPRFLARVKLLRNSFYLLTLVLVTSTITIQQFTSLPLELLDSTQDGQLLVSALKKLVYGITVFWGGLFTAILFATFAPAAWLLFRHTRDHLKGPTTPSDLRQWLYEFVFVSIKKQAMNAIVIITPMLVGPLSELLMKLSGG